MPSATSSMNKTAALLFMKKLGKIQIHTLLITYQILKKNNNYLTKNYKACNAFFQIYNLTTKFMYV